ncbi:MAG: ABC transporter ATP-binding protein [Firmicutes bacterium]|nr:ABC transporter ATP-binding protein [Bacillota bacterium]HHY33970.1 ABC transporter ATP-binding protein [Bacillota bacterium]
MNAIEVENLTRRFNRLCAVDDVTFAAREGEVFGFLGPNGAGKTTTIRMLTGQLRPTAGDIRVAGLRIPGEEKRLKSQIGVVFEHQNLYERMSGRENLAFAAQLYSVPKPRVDEVLEQVGLSERAKDLVRTYSSGMKQRLLLARAWLHRPKVLFLDEPTRGLDPHIAQEIRHLVKGMAGEGVTVFLTTHYMEEADQLCHRVAFLNQGRIVALDSPEQLKLAHGQRRLQAKLVDGRVLSLSIGNQTDGQRLSELVASGEILTLHSLEATLEDVFIKLTGRGVRE